MMGQKIGLMDIDAAYLYQKAAYKLSMIVNMLMMIFFAAFLPFVMRLYNNLDDVIAKVYFDTGLPVIFGISLFWDQLKICQNGMVKALGLQKQVIKISFIGNWPICLTFLLITCFYFKMGLAGIWISKILADIYLVISNYFLVKFDSSEWLDIANTFKEKRQEQILMSK